MAGATRVRIPESVVACTVSFMLLDLKSPSTMSVQDLHCETYFTLSS